MLLLSQIYVAFLSSFLLLSLFLIKPIREKLIFLFYVIIGLSLTSFWWIEFTKFVLNNLNSISFRTINDLLTLDSIFSYNTIVVLLFNFVIFFYFKYRKWNKREILFYGYIVVISWLLLTRIIIFVPIFNNIPPSSYTVFFLLISIFVFFDTGLYVYPRLIRRNVLNIIMIISIISLILLSFNLGDYGKSNILRKELVSIADDIEGRFIIIGNNLDIETKLNFITYAALYYDKFTPSLVIVSANKPIEETKEVNNYLLNRDCKSIIDLANDLDVVNIISSDDDCRVIEECGFREVVSLDRVCVYKN